MYNMYDTMLINILRMIILGEPNGFVVSPMLSLLLVVIQPEIECLLQVDSVKLNHPAFYRMTA